MVNGTVCADWLSLGHVLQPCNYKGWEWGWSGFPKQNQGAVATTWLVMDAEQMEGLERQAG